MMKKVALRLIAIVVVLSTLFTSACGLVQPVEVEGNVGGGDIILGNTDAPALSEEDPIITTSNVDRGGNTAPKGEYDEGTLLVKCEGSFSESMLAELDFVSAEPIFSGSDWYTVTLGEETEATEAMAYLAALDCFDQIDYNYIMKTGADTASAEVSGNPDYVKQSSHTTHKIPEGWKEVKKNGKHPGGSSDVIVAVIDTGVDYTHLDLRNNIWINTAEIPDNGIDDDRNGYVDDVYGWNCVGDNNNPMDDNGHGTHVAGIVAAENNKIGGVGVAYNCKVMVLKAGNSSGYFNNADIAEAIQYAYMNGASVINMSFGGSNISIAVEEALENAYNSCVLVAAAGNDGKCNSGCLLHPSNYGTYPAALPYVIGVMSVNQDGTSVSSFSNYDHIPYNSVEYEVYAVGEGVYSTWPGNKYATLNGTSMAAPMVSGIAALLRSAYPDRDTYSTKYLQSQIVNTGTVNPYNDILETTDSAHSVANVYEALTKIPTPDVKLYDYYIDDSAAISEKNNGNGVIDAGERVRLFVSLHNRGGVATNVNVSIDTMRNNDPALTDPYFSFINNTFALSDIGTYSVRESSPDKYFEIDVSSECPNDYLVDFNIRFTYENGLDGKDETKYGGDGQAQFNVSRGFYLPAIITEDTVYTADRLYIVGEDVVIPEGVTVTFEEGCEIQFYDDREYYNSPTIINYGVLKFLGEKSVPISLKPNERHEKFVAILLNYNSVEIQYSKVINLSIAKMSDSAQAKVHNSSLITEHDSNPYVYVWCYSRGSIVSYSHPYSVADSTATEFSKDYYQNCYIRCTAESWKLPAYSMDNNYIVVSSQDNNDITVTNFTNNVVRSFGKEDDYGQCRLNVPRWSNCIFSNNYFMAPKTIDAISIDLSANGAVILTSNNMFSDAYQKNASQLISGYYDSAGTPTINVYGSCSDITKLWPHIVSVEMFDKDGTPITRVGKEEIKVRVTFNRPMDTTQNTFLTFGTIEPYADYRIDGAYVSETVWEGTYTLKAEIENGQNYLKVNNACAKEDPTKTVFGEYQLHEFTIDTTAALSMNLQAEPTQDGIKLTWFQDDYDTLLGYNIYRADSKDGNYVKLNPAIVLDSDEFFLDENAEPGKTYWYTYTVVLSDFTESGPAGKVSCTGMDSIAPNMYHTPVNQGYLNNNLVISCTASDNIGVTAVTLYYRQAGTAEWKKLTMSKQSDKYSATVFGSELTLDGLEYYIEATDGVSIVSKGTAALPYTVAVKSDSALARLGDVDGDGTVTTKDALMLMQCLAGDLLLSDDQFRRADLNGDGSLSSSEALRILQYINGKLATLEM